MNVRIQFAKCNETRQANAYRAIACEFTTRLVYFINWCSAIYCLSWNNLKFRRAAAVGSCPWYLINLVKNKIIKVILNLYKLPVAVCVTHSPKCPFRLWAKNNLWANEFSLTLQTFMTKALEIFRCCFFSLEWKNWKHNLCQVVSRAISK